MEELDLTEFKEIFVSESKEHLSVLNATLLQLEKNPQDIDLLNEIFRVAHTLKGMAATMGFDKITHLTHEMENILDKLRHSEIVPTDEIVEILFNCFDTLEGLVDEISSGEDKGVSVESLLESLKKISETELRSQVPKVDTQQIDRGEIAESFPAVAEPTSTQTKTQPVPNEPEWPTQESSVAITKTQTVRLKIEQLDKLMNLVGELVINKARLQQISQVYNISELSTALAQFDRICVDLQEEVLKTRMVPVKHIFDRYPRMVRDLAKKLNKEVEFEIIGSEIEIDRTLLEQINEPLVHLLRNAIDHGIESPDERKSLGKHVAGLVKLVAKREKGYCTIEVSDDGKGMDSADILKTAIEKGIVSQEEAGSLSEGDIFMLICAPAFSTAKEITDISGRGVGMDVVKNLVEAFNGKLEIESKRGSGSKFIMHLPLTLAIMQALLVKVSDETYAIPLTNVSEIKKLDTDYVKTIDKKEVLMLRNEVIPLIRLNKVFAVTKSPDHLITKSSDLQCAVITEVKGKKIGLVVDSIVGEQEIVIKTLSGMLKHAKHFSGATILGDGRVVLIIDVPSFV